MVLVNSIHVKRLLQMQIVRNLSGDLPYRTLLPRTSASWIKFFLDTIIQAHDRHKISAKT